jgi:hypothetical protein
LVFSIVSFISFCVFSDSLFLLFGIT